MSDNVSGVKKGAVSKSLIKSNDEKTSLWVVLFYPEAQAGVQLFN